MFLPGPIICAVVVASMIAVWSFVASFFRLRNVKKIERINVFHEDHAIAAENIEAVVRLLWCTEFPFALRFGLELSLLKCCALPAFSTLVIKSDAFMSRTWKWMDDADLLFREVVEQGGSTQRGTAALTRLAHIAAHHGPPPGDCLDIWAIVVTEPILFVYAHEWRHLTPRELYAWHHVALDLGIAVCGHGISRDSLLTRFPTLSHILRHRAQCGDLSALPLAQELSIYGKPVEPLAFRTALKISKRSPLVATPRGGSGGVQTVEGALPVGMEGEGGLLPVEDSLDATQAAAADSKGNEHGTDEDVDDDVDKAAEAAADTNRVAFERARGAPAIRPNPANTVARGKVLRLLMAEYCPPLWEVEPNSIMDSLDVMISKRLIRFFDSLLDTRFLQYEATVPPSERLSGAAAILGKGLKPLLPKRLHRLVESKARGLVPLRGRKAGGVERVTLADPAAAAIAAAVAAGPGASEGAVGVGTPAVFACGGGGGGANAATLASQRGGGAEGSEGSPARHGGGGGVDSGVLNGPGASYSGNVHAGTEVEGVDEDDVAVVASAAAGAGQTASLLRLLAATRRRIDIDRSVIASKGGIHAAMYGGPTAPRFGPRYMLSPTACKQLAVRKRLWRLFLLSFPGTPASNFKLKKATILVTLVRTIFSVRKVLIGKLFLPRLKLCMRTTNLVVPMAAEDLLGANGVVPAGGQPDVAFVKRSAANVPVDPDPLKIKPSTARGMKATLRPNPVCKAVRSSAQAETSVADRLVRVASWHLWPPLPVNDQLDRAAKLDTCRDVAMETGEALGEWNTHLFEPLAYVGCAASVGLSGGCPHKARPPYYIHGYVISALGCYHGQLSRLMQRFEKQLDKAKGNVWSTLAGRGKADLDEGEAVVGGSGGVSAESAPVIGTIGKGVGNILDSIKTMRDEARDKELEEKEKKAREAEKAEDAAVASGGLSSMRGRVGGVVGALKGAKRSPSPDLIDSVGSFFKKDVGGLLGIGRKGGKALVGDSGRGMSGGVEGGGGGAVATDVPNRRADSLPPRGREGAAPPPGRAGSATPLRASATTPAGPRTLRGAMAGFEAAVAVERQPSSPPMLRMALAHACRIAMRTIQDHFDVVFALSVTAKERLFLSSLAKLSKTTEVVFDFAAALSTASTPSRTALQAAPTPLRSMLRGTIPDIPSEFGSPSARPRLQSPTV